MFPQASRCVFGLSMTLTAKEFERYTQGKKIAEQKSDLKGAMLLDVDQEVEFTTPGPLMPCLVKHGKIISISKESLFTPGEHLASMGDLAFTHA